METERGTARDKEKKKQEAGNKGGMGLLAGVSFSDRLPAWLGV